LKSQTKEFLAEAEELLGAMDKDIMSLARGVCADVVDHSVLNKIFRSVHTLKGLSSIFDFTDITELSHALEDKLDMVRLGRIVLDDKCLVGITAAQRLLFRIVSERAFTGFGDEVRTLISSFKMNCEAKIPLADPLIEESILVSLTEYERFRLKDNLKSAKDLFMVSASFETKTMDSQYGVFTGALSKVSEIIATLPATENDSGKIAFDTLIATSAAAEDIERAISCISEARLQRLGGEAEDMRFLTAEGKTPLEHNVSYVESMRRNSRTIRVDVEKIESLMSCVEEVCRLREPFMRLMEGAEDEKSSLECSCGMLKFSARLEDSLTRMRECVLAIKMVRVGRLFKRFEPYIERLAHERGKEVDVTTYGEDTELDMTIIEEIADPLMHIIRNVMDHAVELPSQRVACGKSRAAAITLSAYYEGEKVVIGVKDDGPGIDSDLVCERAVSKGFIDGDEAAALGRRDKLDLIFLPGFTTSDKISLTSGRGVGLDVVRENIELINGIVEVETVCGKGTRFILSIPVTQVMKGLLMCEEGGKTFALSGSRVEEIVKLPHGASIGDGFLNIRKAALRAIRPSELFQTSSPSTAEKCYAIVTSVGTEKLCLIVDKVLSELNMIIRPLPFEHKIEGILGLSEAVDNEAVLVLDIAGIIDHISTDDKASSLRD